MTLPCVVRCLTLTKYRETPLQLDTWTSRQKAQRFHRRHGLQSKVERRVFVRGALVAKDPDSYARVPGLTRVERKALESESTESFLGQIKLLTKELRIILVTCCIAAIVQ